jgi:hypothetical protein
LDVSNHFKAPIGKSYEITKNAFDVFDDSSNALVEYGLNIVPNKEYKVVLVVNIKSSDNMIGGYEGRY